MLIYLRSKYPLRILPWAKVSFWDDTCSLSTIKLPRRAVSTCHLCLPFPITLHPLPTGFCPYLFTTLHFQISRGFFWLNPMPPYSTHLSLLLSGVGYVQPVPFLWISFELHDITTAFPPTSWACPLLCSGGIFFCRSLSFLAFQSPLLILYLRNVCLYQDLSPEFLSWYSALYCTSLLGCPDDLSSSTRPTSKLPSSSSPLPWMNLLFF